MKHKSISFLCAAMMLAVAARGQSTATVNIQVDQPGAAVSSNLFGIFFEEINFAGEGGIYAEMVRNRTFYNPTNAVYWTLVTQGSAVGSMSVAANQPLNTNLVNSLNLTFASGTGSVGAGNSGFWGLAVQTNAVYDLNFYACAASGFSGAVAARLQSTNGGTVYAQTSFSGLTTNWQHFAASLVSAGTDTNAQLVLSISNAGTLWLDVVSLFPRATFHSRTNGLRADLANLLVALNPSFFRFPGGNYIESYNLTNAVRWKKSIGGVAQRPGHLNDSWGYWSTDGFGAEEFFQFCEDLGMQPLYGINAGLMLNYSGSANNTVPLSDMGPWVQDALDLIQYANGDTNTTWGAQRAANGHAAPFNLNLMEIGNENGGSYYDPRYTLFYDAIMSNSPAMKLISPVWGSPSSPVSRPVQIRDEHYYSSPSTFIGYATKYDGYSRNGPKVFVGEYAVTSGYGTYGNLSAALGEAAFMTGMERNSDIVQMASYAPLFANVNSIQWQPDLIYYDNSRVFGTPSYYMQRLFSQNRGDEVLPAAVAVNTNSATTHGAIGVGSWNTSVQYTNITVTSNGVTLYQSDFVKQGTNGWNVFAGTWSTNSGLYQQTAQVTDCYATTGNTNWANYTLTLQARKVAGAEGFLILFNVLDNSDWTWWNVGGWSDTLDGIEQMVGGAKTTYAEVSQTIATNVWYNIQIVVTGQRIQCYLGTNSVQMATNLVQDVTLSSPQSGLLASATYARSAGQVVIKAVNPYSTALATTFNLSGVGAVAASGTLIQLTSGSAANENSFSAPMNVFPTTNTMAIAGSNFTMTLPAYSLSVIRVNASGINTYTSLLASVPALITNGATVSGAVWGKWSGNWVNLTANTNHAITWSSSNPKVAVVDDGGNVTGLDAGTVDIVASYAALGLSATQTVQVAFMPVLAHRYSFSETAGTNAADSIGGAAWTGTLPRGGTFGGGVLSLASSSSQYLQLPAGILSNYSAVTIEAWVTFPDQLPANCFLFGFGTSSGSSGYNYIFCAPQGGRAAITSGGYSLEQNAYTGVDFSYHTNFHLAFVYDPPEQFFKIYTNGVLAAANGSITNGFSTVNNVYSWIGRSLYSADPYPDLTLDELRIYNGALRDSEIAATDALGTDQLLSTATPVLGVSSGTSGLTLSWPLAAAGFTVMTTTNLADGVWTAAAVTPQIEGTVWQVVLPAAGSVQFYQLQR